VVATAADVPVTVATRCSSGRPRIRLRLRNSPCLPAPNNGTHPTRDTRLVLFFQRIRRAGDAGR